MGAMKGGGLTPKQERYKNERLKGKSQAEAYDIAYDSHGGSKATRKRNAEALEASDGMATALKAERERLAKVAAASRDERLAVLSEFVFDPEESTSNRINAIKALNEMTGANAPERVEVSISAEERERAAAAAILAILEE